MANKLEVSIGIIAYNEEKNIGRLIERVLAQEQSNISISEIILVSDGSTDATNDIISQYCRKDARIRPFIFTQREGKYRGVNVFLQEARSTISILCSADILFSKDTMSRLCEPFSDQNTIMSIARPIPINADTLLDRCVQINWDLHHALARIKPKGTELLAFRKSPIQIAKTTVDEEYLLALSSMQGTIVYSDTVLFFNKGPTKVSEFISQVRRNCAGHLFLVKETGHVPITIQNWRCARKALSDANRYKFAIIPFLLMQGIGRSLGFWDYLMDKKDVCWKVALTTKDLSEESYSIKLSQPIQDT